MHYAFNQHVCVCGGGRAEMGPFSWSVQGQPRLKICCGLRPLSTIRCTCLCIRRLIRHEVIRCHQLSNLSELEIRDELEAQGVVKVIV